MLLSISVFVRQLWIFYAVVLIFHWRSFECDIFCIDICIAWMLENCWGHFVRRFAAMMVNMGPITHVFSAVTCWILEIFFFIETWELSCSFLVYLFLVQIGRKRPRSNMSTISTHLAFWEHPKRLVSFRLKLNCLYARSSTSNNASLFHLSCISCACFAYISL